MTAYAGTRIVNQTLAASTVDVVTFPQNIRGVEVTNFGAANSLFVTTDGVTVPTVGGQNCFEIPPGASAILPNLQPPNEVITNFNLATQPSPCAGDTNYYTTTVQLICSTTNAYSVSATPVVRSV